MGATYAKTNRNVDPEIKQALLQEAQEPEKPWTLVRNVAHDREDTKDEVKGVLRILTLEGELTPTATGEIRVVKNFDNSSE